MNTKSVAVEMRQWIIFCIAMLHVSLSAISDLFRYSSNMWSTAPFLFQYVIYLSQPLIPQVTYLLQPPSRQVHSSWDVPFGRIRSPVHLFTDSSTVGSREPWAMQSHAEFVKTVICSEEMAVQCLREHNLLDDPKQAVINCDKCGSVMQNKED